MNLLSHLDVKPKKALITIVCCLTVGMLVGVAHWKYQAMRNPINVYGTWVEADVPSYDSERVTFGNDGVYRNYKLVATSFEFNGSTVTVKTGQGKFLYQVIGENKLRLKKTAYNNEPRKFVKISDLK